MDLKDLQMMLVVIDTVVKRGAIEGPEMEPVGKLRTRLAQFIQAAQEPKVEEEEQVDE